MALPHALPLELLSLVFFSIYNDAEGMTETLLSRTSYELLDTLLVCRRWNDIACQTPRLWTTVYVAHDPDASVRAQTYANRAGHLELNVVVTSKSKNTSAENCEKAFKQIVCEYSFRLCSITLPFSTPSISETLHNPLPNLVSFTCTPKTDSDHHILISSGREHGKVTLDTPKLQTLALHDHEISFVGDNWPTLRSLDCYFGDGGETWAWGLLGAFQHTLESLVLCDSDDTLGTWAMHSHSLADGIIPCTSLPNLTSLEVVGFGDWCTLRFADMPALRFLSMTLACLPDSEGQEGPLPTFERLRSLLLFGPFEDDGNLHYLLQSTPNISSLTVIEMGQGTFANDDSDDDPDKGHIIDPLLLNSETPSGGPRLCPNLEEISLILIPITMAKLKELVDLRLPRLRKIEVDSILWAEETCSGEENKAQNQAHLEWLNERVELSGFSGRGDESPEPQSPA